MDYIQLNQAFIAYIAIPGSSGSDTVSYSIYKGSNGAVFQSGSMTFVADEIWKVQFTPIVWGESYILKVNDSTISSKRENFYKCLGSVQTNADIISSQAFSAYIPIPSSSSSDTVTYSIYIGSTGVALQSGNMVFLADEVWSVNFTPLVAGETYILKVHDATIDSKRENFYLCVSGSSTSTSDDLTTLETFKTNFNIPSTNISMNALIQNLITQNSKIILKKCGRKFKSTVYDATASVDDILYDVNRDQIVMLRQWPIISVQSINIDWNRVWGAATLLDSTNYVIDPDLGRIRFKYPFTYWYEQFFRYSPQAKVIQVYYTAGYDPLPSDLAYACERMVMADYLEAVGSVNVAASNDVIYKPDKLRKSAMLIIDSYKAWFIGE